MLLIYFSKVAIKYYIRKPARLGTIYSEIYSIPFLVTEVVRRHRMDPSIFPTMLSGERWSKQVSTTVALTVQTLYGEVFSAITWYSMAWHGVVGTLTDQTLYGGGSPDICGPGKSALNVGVQCSCPPFKNQMLQNFDKTYCLTSSNGPALEAF